MLFGIGHKNAVTGGCPQNQYYCLHPPKEPPIFGNKATANAPLFSQLNPKPTSRSRILCANIPVLCVPSILVWGHSQLVTTVRSTTTSVRLQIKTLHGFWLWFCVRIDSVASSCALDNPVVVVKVLTDGYVMLDPEGGHPLVTEGNLTRLLYYTTSTPCQNTTWLIPRFNCVQNDVSFRFGTSCHFEKKR